MKVFIGLVRPCRVATASTTRMAAAPSIRARFGHGLPCQTVPIIYHSGRRFSVSRRNNHLCMGRVGRRSVSRYRVWETVG